MSLLDVRFNGESVVGQQIADAVRRAMELGTPTTTKETPMPAVNTENPYERRDRERARRAHGGEFATGGAMEPMPRRGELYAPRAIAMEDLEALVASAQMRTEQTVAANLERRHDADRLSHSRMAWDQGHEAGQVAGRRVLLAEIGEQFEEIANDLRSRLREFHDGLDPQEPWDAKKKLDAIDLICEARDTLDNLVHAHHADFVVPVPF